MPLLSIITYLLILTLSAAHYDSPNSSLLSLSFSQSSLPISNQRDPNFLQEKSISSENLETLTSSCLPISNYTQIMRYLTLYGDWNGTKVFSLLIISLYMISKINTFTNYHGFVAFANRMNPVVEDSDDTWNFTLHFYDGEYVDQKEIRMTFTITDPIHNLIANYSEAYIRIFFERLKRF